MSYEHSDDRERYSESEDRESTEDHERENSPEDKSLESARNLEREEEAERAAEKSSRELEECESESRDAKEIADESSRELDSLERENEQSIEDELGHDLQETRDDLHDRFVNDMERQLEGPSYKDSETDEHGEDGTSSEATESSESYHDAGDGMAYAMETKGGSEEAEAAETETEEETQEVSEPGAQEPAESQTESEAAEEPVNEKGTNRITRQESEEGETTTKSEAEQTHDPKTSSTNPEVSETEEDTQEVNESRSESGPAVSKETQHETRELAETVEDKEEPAEETITETSEPDTGPEDYEQDTLESYEEPASEPVSHEVNEAQEDIAEQESPEQEITEDPEVETESQENETSAEDESLPEDLEDFVKRVQDILDEKMDDDYDYVQDPLTGEMQRVPKILVEYESEEQRERRRLRNLFAELSEEDREQFKELVREKAESEDERSAEEIERQWTIVVEIAERSRKHGADVQEVYRLYFDKGLSMLEVGKKLGFKSQRSVQRIFKEQGWKARPSGFQRKSEDYMEMHRLYFEGGYTLKEIAQRYGMDRHTIGKIFKEQGWVTRRTSAIRKGKLISKQTAKRKLRSQSKRSKSKPKQTAAKKSKPNRRNSQSTLLKKTTKKKIDTAEVYKLYFVDGLTMMEISKKLGFKSAYSVSQLFKEMGWKPLTQSARKKNKDFDVLDVFRFYYIEGLTKEEITSKLGIPESRLRKVFKKMRWPTKIRQFVTEEERALAKNEGKKKTSKRIKDLREEKFGTKCRLCGDTRKLAIHKKDGVEHERDILWRIKFLKSVNTDDWAALCIPCHRGVHWLMKTKGYEWTDLENLVRSKKLSEPKNLEPLALPSDTTSSSSRYLELRSKYQGDVLRNAYFGDACYFCGENSKERRIPLHRKDGRLHPEKLTKRERYFRTLNPDEWVPLCNKHHRHVHWAMDTLNLEWDDLKSVKRD